MSDWGLANLLADSFGADNRIKNFAYSYEISRIWI